MTSRRLTTYLVAALIAGGILSFALPLPAIPDHQPPFEQQLLPNPTPVVEALSA